MNAWRCKEEKAALIDHLYDLRQDDKLGDGTLCWMLDEGKISKFTYDLIRRLPIK